MKPCDFDVGVLQQQYSLLFTHHSLLITRYALLITHYRCPTTHYLLLDTTDVRFPSVLSALAQYSPLVETVPNCVGRIFRIRLRAAAFPIRACDAYHIVLRLMGPSALRPQCATACGSFKHTLLLPPLCNPPSRLQVVCRDSNT